MHIAVVTNMLAPYRVPLFRALAARPEVHRLTVLVCVDKESDREWTVASHPGFELFQAWGISLQQSLENNRLRVIHLRFGVMTWLAKHRPDRVLIGDASLTSHLAALACRSLRVPYFVWSEITPCSKVSEGGAARLRRWLYSGAQGYVAAGKEAARFLIEKGVPASRIRCATNAVDTEKLKEAATTWRPHRASIKASLGIPPQAFVFLYVGQFIARKRVQETMALLEAAAAERPVHLILAGSGPLEQALREQAKACRGLTTSFTGFVEDDTLWRLYAAAHALILLSDDEPWGMVISEALAFGLPFLATNTVAAAVEFSEFGVVCRDLGEAASELHTVLGKSVACELDGLRDTRQQQLATPESWARELTEALS